MAWSPVTQEVGVVLNLFHDIVIGQDWPLCETVGQGTVSKGLPEPHTVVEATSSEMDWVGHETLETNDTFSSYWYPNNLCRWYSIWFTMIY